LSNNSVKNNDTAKFSVVYVMFVYPQQEAKEKKRRQQMGWDNEYEVEKNYYFFSFLCSREKQ